MSSPAGPQVAVRPDPPPRWLARAVAAGGGTVVDASRADALMWFDEEPDPAALDAVLAGAPSVRWVQLPAAGVDTYGPALDPARTWTGTGGLYGSLVAEHALALALAGLHGLLPAARARTWGPSGGRALAGGRATVLGAGDVATALIPLLRALDVEVTVVRRTPDPVPGAAHVLPLSERVAAVRGRDLVVLALALTPETRHVVGRAELAAMGPEAWLVNVARGAHVDTDALVTALRDGTVGGAALDVTDPEPLPDGHPLWDLDRCLVTPHAASPLAAVEAQVAQRVRTNVERWGAGQPLDGVIDVALGY